MLNKRQVVYVPALWLKAAHGAVVGATGAREEAAA